MNKKERLQLISDMVSRYPIDTQEEIVSRLLQAGLKATQATVSRDIKTLGIVKIPSEHGYIYGLPNGHGKTNRLKLRYILSCKRQDQMIHIDVEPGTMAVVKRQLLDRLGDTIFSLVGDDDSLLMVVKTSENTQEILRQIEEL